MIRVLLLLKRKEHKQKEARIYNISEKNANEEIKAESYYFFVIKILYFKK